MLDAVSIRNGSLMVEGLGEARPVGNRIEARSNDGTCWQWLCLRFGQSIFAKQRTSLKQFDDMADLGTDSSRGSNNQLGRPVVATGESRDEQPKRTNRQPELFSMQVLDSNKSEGSGSLRQRTVMIYIRGHQMGSIAH